MTVELIKPHTHAGVQCVPGTRLDVDEATARWLIERGVAKPTEAPDEPGVKPQFTARKGD
ncbi:MULTISPECIES: DUF7210 family protein [Burkholderiaceae]|jgi:hypothetical protein|uniref:DUF7210 domain-containing protein n=2 Tax=Burkholderiaceae TaxID=119060 RepID=A0A5E4URT4_9BURK|nr:MULTISPECIES: hypothetical protein [Burkholderiaceae]ALD91881.1 hypothetical protein CR3_2689 [Cupriavidus gilardii CR3]MBU65570.1 hypothetical protein [Cupriavidus sp.]AYY96142.1 hypothetical protein EGY19_00865 [Burkholderia multivorans]KAA6131007.1 hypothetical protein F1599_03235 [Cupriavidus cauae]KWW33622.1 hypothetical protein AU374_04742 [Cupriavidus metallidurans]